MGAGPDKKRSEPGEQGAGPSPRRGRFAPTPSGPLHFGSLVAAAASYLDARAQGGEWHLRIDDLDPPRVQPGAETMILSTLEQLGFAWDGPVVRQSGRTDAYQAALDRLRTVAGVYACTCSRTDIARAGFAGIEGPRYPGTCRGKPASPRPHAIRLDVSNVTVAFDDALQGPVAQILDLAIGDPVLRRADGVFAYHLACVVDDAASDFTDVVRGADLLASTPRQIHLQRLLGLPTPAYLHLPVALDPAGRKLSKQTQAPAVGVRQWWDALAPVMTFLGHAPPAQLRDATLAAFWQWGIAAWRRERIPRRAAASVLAAANQHEHDRIGGQLLQ